MLPKQLLVGDSHKFWRKGIPISGSFIEELFWKLMAMALINLHFVRRVQMGRYEMGMRHICNRIEMLENKSVKKADAK